MNLVCDTIKHISVMTTRDFLILQCFLSMLSYLISEKNKTFVNEIRTYEFLPGKFESIGEIGAESNKFVPESRTNANNWQVCSFSLRASRFEC